MDPLLEGGEGRKVEDIREDDNGEAKAPGLDPLA